MYNFILQISLMASLAAMIYMISRGVARVNDVAEENPAAPQKSRFDKLVARLPMEKIDLLISEYFEKFLRKSKLSLMKLDNLVSGHLEKIKKTNGNGKSNGDKKPSLFSENLISEKENTQDEKIENNL